MGGERMDAKNGPVTRKGNDAAEAHGESPASGSKLWAALKDKTLGVLDKSAKTAVALALAGAVANACADESVPFNTDAEDETADVGQDASDTEGVVDVADVDGQEDVDNETVEGGTDVESDLVEAGVVCEGVHDEAIRTYTLRIGEPTEMGEYNVTVTGDNPTETGVLVDVGCVSGGTVASGEDFVFHEEREIDRTNPEERQRLKINMLARMGDFVLCMASVESI